MKRLTLFLLSLLLAVSALQGCTSTPVNDRSEDIAEKKEYQYVIDETRFNIIQADGTTQFVIVRKDVTSGTVLEACKKLKNAIFEHTGVEVDIVTDFVKEGHPDFQPKEFEILVGHTNRPESEQALALTSRAKDIAVLQSGNRLAILANDDANIDSAVEYFISNYIDSETCSVSTEIGEKYVSVSDYSVDTFTLNGVDIGEYAICYVDGKYEPYAREIATFIYDNFGKTVEVKQNHSYDEHHISLDKKADPETEEPSADIGALEFKTQVDSMGITLFSGVMCDHEQYVKNFVEKYFSDSVLSENIAHVIKSSSVTEDNEYIRVDDFDLVADIEKKANDRKEYIKNTPNLFTEDVLPLKDGQKIIYVSSSGSDINDGLSPQTPIYSLSKLGVINLNPGDRVLFKRGEEFRGRIKTRPGVIYSSYGKGAKPIINGNLKDVAQKHLWTETDTENVYKCSLKFDNVGNIVFDYSGIVGNHEETHGNLRLLESHIDLKNDLDFISDLETGYLYLCSTEGNPGERFESIEICEGVHIFSESAPDVVIDNLNMMFSGAHGVSMGDVENRTVQNCIFSWIGGSILKGYNGGNSVRYGNAVEVYGACDGYYVYDNWMYQIYDTGVTHQYSSDNRVIQMKNIEYRGNIIEKCHWSIEYYNRGKMPGSCVHDVHVHDNIVLHGAYGWGSVGREAGSGMHNGFDMIDDVKNYVVENNIFAYSKGGNLVRYEEGGDRKLTLRNNTYVQFYGRTLGYFFGKVEKFDGSAVRHLVDLMGEEDPTIVFIMHDYEKEAEIAERLAAKEAEKQN